MKRKYHLFIYIALIVVAGILLVIQQITHIEFLLHLAAIPFEILVAVFIVESLLESRQKEEKKRQLMLMKSYMFRLEMRDLFISNLLAIKSPTITIPKIKNASLHELTQMRRDAESIEYKSIEGMEPVIMEYANVQHVWRHFMDLAREWGFEDIFQDMVYILHFIGDVKTFKDNHPDKLFIKEAVNNPILMKKVNMVLGDGIRKFLDYAIESKEKQPELFDALILDYEMTSQIRSSNQSQL